MAAPKPLPYGRQVIDDDDIAAVADALRDDLLTTGPRVAAFEAAFAETVGARYAVACNSGTAALHLATLALGLGPGDWLVVPTMTFLATANCARYVGADVIFADVDAETGLMTADTLAEALSRAQRAGRSAKAISTVHLSGRSAPLADIGAIASARGLPLIEDASHALGTTYVENGVTARIGDNRHGVLTTFSFHPVKTIACGEGGMVTTGDERLARRMRLVRSHGMVRSLADVPVDARSSGSQSDWLDPWYYEMHQPGLNYRIPDILCALGLSQLAKLDTFVARRRRLAALYDQALAPLAPIVRTVPPVPGCDPALHLYAVLIDFAAAGRSRRDVVAALRARGILTQVHYIPVHRQPYYENLYGGLSLPGAEAYYARELSLPLFPSMTDDDVRRVVDAVSEVLGRP